MYWTLQGHKGLLFLEHFSYNAKYTKKNAGKHELYLNHLSMLWLYKYIVMFNIVQAYI